MSFSADNKNIKKPFTVEYGGKEYTNWIGIMLERHPEMFFKYQLGDTIVYILCHSSGGAKAFFEDDTYFYSMYASYDND